MTSTEWDAMRESEALEWIDRVRKEHHTRQSGDARLRGILADIEKQRGKSGRDDLQQRIERILGRAL